MRERAPHAVLHTDAVQAPQWLDFARARPPSVELVAISGHKFGGPKGVGALVVRDGTELVPLIEGGGHERGLRAGTQNVAGIVAFATALRVTHERRAEETARIAALRDDARTRARGARSRASTSTARRTPRVAGHPALHVRRRRGRDAARRARPAGGHGGVGLGVQLGRGRPVARAARDGHAARPRALVGPVLARLRVDAAPTSTPRSRSSPKSSPSCGSA